MSTCRETTHDLPPPPVRESQGAWDSMRPHHLETATVTPTATATTARRTTSRVLLCMTGEPFGRMRAVGVADLNPARTAPVTSISLTPAERQRLLGYYRGDAGAEVRLRAHVLLL